MFTRVPQLLIHVVLLTTCLLIGGCANLGGLCVLDCGRQAHSASSLVEFLYADGAPPPQNDAIPELKLPLRVGLAMLPSRSGANAPGLDAAQRQQLLEKVRDRFRSRAFISEIVIIPDYYLASPRGGFGTLEAVQRLYSLDLIALVSWDQTVYSDENRWSLGYLSIVGAFVLKGSHSDLATLVDLAVVDPQTRSLLLRAGGTDSAARNTTAIDREAEVRRTRIASFDAATNTMAQNFDIALTEFEADVRSGKARVTVAHREPPQGGGGIGGIGGFDSALLLALATAALARRRWLRGSRGGQSG